MNDKNKQVYTSEGKFGNLEDIEKIRPLAVQQNASIYALDLKPAEKWRKPKALSGILFLVLINGQVLVRISNHETQEEKMQFMREDSVRFIDSKDSLSLESLYGNTKLLILQLPSTASYSDSVQVDLRYFSNSKENKHVSKKMDEQSPLYN